MAAKIPRHLFTRNLSRNSVLLSSNQNDSVWKIFKDKDKKKKSPKPPKERCQRQRLKDAPEPDLSCLGGQPYRTCGTAFIIQKDTIPIQHLEPDEEQIILRRIETDPSLKDTLQDPMPPFRSVEQRLLDLTERKLHPLYKRYMSIPKRKLLKLPSGEEDVTQYKSFQGGDEENCVETNPEQLPKQLKINKELLERKNIFADFKKIELPRQMLARLIEMDQNRKPTLEQKKKTDSSSS